MADEKMITDERLEAMVADAELLLQLITDEEAEGEVEAGQLLLEDLPALCDEVKRLRTALEYYADIALWDRVREGVQEEDLGAVARNALRGA